MTVKSGDPSPRVVCGGTRAVSGRPVRHPGLGQGLIEGPEDSTERWPNHGTAAVPLYHLGGFDLVGF